MNMDYTQNSHMAKIKQLCFSTKAIVKSLTIANFPHIDGLL